MRFINTQSTSLGARESEGAALGRVCGAIEAYVADAEVQMLDTVRSNRRGRVECIGRYWLDLRKGSAGNVEFLVSHAH